VLATTTPWRWSTTALNLGPVPPLSGFPTSQKNSSTYLGGFASRSMSVAGSNLRLEFDIPQLRSRVPAAGHDSLAAPTRAVVARVGSRRLRKLPPPGSRLKAAPAHDDPGNNKIGQ